MQHEHLKNCQML